MPCQPLLFFCWMLLLSRNNVASSNHVKPVAHIGTSNDNPYAFIQSVPLPYGYSRSQPDTASFAWWLRHVPLKRDKTVYLFNGSKKANQQAQFAVLDIPVGAKDLQQCADAVMHLRAAWLFHERRFNEICFFDNEHHEYRFNAPYTNSHFDDYLLQVYGMCGSASLSKQLQSVNDVSSIEPGDVFVRGGFPGHAVIVMDVAVNAAGKKIFLLAQGFMPAQDIHVLINPSDDHLCPWYTAENTTQVLTPEFRFYGTELKRW